MIFDNKKIPDIWSNNKSTTSIMNKIFKNKEFKKLSHDNNKNNQLLYEYNKKLKIDEKKKPNKINLYEYNFGYDKTLVSFLKWQRTERTKMHLKNKKNLLKNLSSVELKENKIKYNFNKKLKISCSENKFNLLSDIRNNSKKNNNTIIKSYKNKINNNNIYKGINILMNMKTINNNNYTNDYNSMDDKKKFENNTIKKNKINNNNKIKIRIINSNYKSNF